MEIKVFLFLSVHLFDAGLQEVFVQHQLFSLMCIQFKYKLVSFLGL